MIPFSTIPIAITLLVLVFVYLVFLRPRQLRWGATDAEVNRSMPGDEIVDKPSFNATRAVTIHAPLKISIPGSFKWASAGQAGIAMTCWII